MVDIYHNGQMYVSKEEYAKLQADNEALKAKVATLENLLKSKEAGFSQNPNGFGKLNPLGDNND